MDFGLIFWLMILTAIGAGVWLFRSLSRVALVSVICLDLLAFVWAGIGCWCFRDGLGPGLVPSTGFEALRRFASDMIFPSIICGFVIIIAIGFFLWRKRRTHDVA